jgi:hypothetical protein
MTDLLFGIWCLKFGILDKAMPIIRDIPFTLTKTDVIRGLGMGANPTVRPQIDRLVDETLNDAATLKLIRPALAHEIVKVARIEGEDCFLEGGTIFHGATIPRLLSRAKALAVGVATIGPELENSVSDCFKSGKRLKGLILDAMGSSTMENMRFAIRDIINKEAEKRGWTASSPVSPGGPSWPLSEQFKLFPLVPAGEIGVHLTETAMMVPRKSTSMVFGLGENMPTWSPTERCDMCPRGATCSYRYRPEHECEPVKSQ